MKKLFSIKNFGIYISTKWGGFGLYKPEKRSLLKYAYHFEVSVGFIGILFFSKHLIKKRIDRPFNIKLTMEQFGETTEYASAPVWCYRLLSNRQPYEWKNEIEVEIGIDGYLRIIREYIENGIYEMEKIK